MFDPLRCSNAMNVLLESLRSVHLGGGVFMDGHLTAPWCVVSDFSAGDCRAFGDEPDHVITYHYVAEGEMLLQVGGDEPIRVTAGEIVVLPGNDEHRLGSTLDAPATWVRSLVQRAASDRLSRIDYGGGGAQTQIFCGFLASGPEQRSLIAMLPKVLKLNVSEGVTEAFVASSFRYAAQELTEQGSPSGAVLERVAELLFIEAVRRYLQSRPPTETGWVAGTKDPVISEAIALMHAAIARRWTTSEIAAHVGLSRSAFAKRFTEMLGVPPMRYLAERRLQQATTDLRETQDTIASIALRCGYESEQAFSHAFRREFGKPPAAWRTSQRVIHT